MSAAYRSPLTGWQSALCVRRCGLPACGWTALATREPCWPPRHPCWPDNENIGCLLESRQASQVRAIVNTCCLLVLHPLQTPDSVEESWNWPIGAGQRRSAAHRRGKQGTTDTSDSCAWQQYKSCYRAGIERLLMSVLGLLFAAKNGLLRVGTCVRVPLLIT